MGQVVELSPPQGKRNNGGSQCISLHRTTVFFVSQPHTRIVYHNGQRLEKNLTLDVCDLLLPLMLSHLHLNNSYIITQKRIATLFSVLVKGK